MDDAIKLYYLRLGELHMATVRFADAVRSAGEAARALEGREMSDEGLAAQIAAECKRLLGEAIGAAPAIRDMLVEVN